jgi:hypothetical protein
MTKLAELAPRLRFDAKRALEQPPAHKDKYLIERCLPVCETIKERCYFDCPRNRERRSESVF